MSAVLKSPVIEPDVLSFAEKAGEFYGRAAGESFALRMFTDCHCDTTEMQSPIEKLLWIAVHTICKINSILINELQQENGQAYPGQGLTFEAQVKLGNYRVDFAATFRGETDLKKLIADKFAGMPIWIVECDGHEFHERNKKERQYEKQRDRFFTMRGDKVIRYTGSEIVRDPYLVAVEVVKAVTGRKDIATPHSGGV